MSVPRRQRIKTREVGDVTVVMFVDCKTLDEQNIQRLGEDLFRLVDDEGRKKILLNFSVTEYLSPAVLGKLITLQKKLLEMKGRLVFCSMQPQLYEVFEISGLHNFFIIESAEDAALKHFASSAS